MTYAPNSPIVTVLNAGIYKISYMLVSSGHISYCLRINGAILPNSIFKNASGSSVTGIVTVELAANSTIEILNVEESMMSDEINTLLDVLRVE